MSEHERFMKEALALAEQAAESGEVPVGAVIVLEGDIIGRGHNLRQTSGDPTAHAEMLAIREASNAVGNWRLEETCLYVTLEPCAMCAGAIVNARIPKVVYGCDDPKAGAVQTLYTLLHDSRLNHRCEVLSGVLAEQSSLILSRFFEQLRQSKKVLVDKPSRDE
jgi:tRNA(adenine34) deaminase